MTDRLRRERELPEGYQFGDSRGWNTIEADHAPTHEHRHCYYTYDIDTDLFVCACGATQQDRS